MQNARIIGATIETCLKLAGLLAIGIIDAQHLGAATGANHGLRLLGEGGLCGWDIWE